MNALEQLLVANREKQKEKEGGFASEHGVVQCAIESWGKLKNVLRRDGEILTNRRENRSVLGSVSSVVGNRVWPCLCSAKFAFRGRWRASDGM